MRSMSLRACLLVLVACDAPPAPEAAPKPAVAPTPVAPTPIAPTPVAPTPIARPSVAPPDVAPPPEAPLEGSGPSGAEGRVARRQAVLDLLTDGRSAAALDVIAASPGRAFDPQLADDMTPKVYISRSTVPEIRQLKATIDGPLDKDIVRRIVRAHINEVRFCYNQGLARNPNLAGRLELEFEILDDGKVGTAAVRASTLADQQVGTCAATMVRRWTFPKPEKLTKVIYPFELAPGMHR
jgi:hypothetical protein